MQISENYQGQATNVFIDYVIFVGYMLVIFFIRHSFIILYKYYTMEFGIKLRWKTRLVETILKYSAAEQTESEILCLDHNLYEEKINLLINRLKTTEKVKYDPTFFYNQIEAKVIKNMPNYRIVTYVKKADSNRLFIYLHKIVKIWH